jgi:hypothetical protein
MDLKFKGNKFYFSILPATPNAISPLLIPVISNPNFLDPSTFGIKGVIGITELLKGDLGITERIMMPILEPILSMVAQSSHVAKSLVDANKPLEETNPAAVATEDNQAKIADKAKAIMLKNYIPEDTGLKPLEKTIVTTMMESYKPVFDFAKILIEMLGIAEDVVCRFLGTSIKVMGKQIGFPSRNPKYWNETLGYAKTLSCSKKDFDQAFSSASKAFINAMSSTHPLKGNENGVADKDYIGDDREALYIGYFDGDGNEVTPPAWVLNSNKWFEKDVMVKGKPSKLSSPFKRLSSELNAGVEQIRSYHMSAVERLETSKADIIKELDLQMSKSVNVDDIKNIELQKAATEVEFKGLIQTVLDMLDGTNIGGGNYVDDEDKSKGVNEPSTLSEWLSKSRGSQLRQKYFPEAVSTTQALVDKNGEAKEPYVFIPKTTINFKGNDIRVEMPLAYAKQIKQEKINSDSVYYDKRKGKLGKDYSMRNVVEDYDMYSNTDPKKPYHDNTVTHFAHSEKDVYIPDALKNFYLPIEWEEVFEYEIRNKATGELVRTEKENVPYKIDIEKDYEVRVIKVVNRSLPLASTEDLDHIAVDGVEAEQLTGTVYNKGNNIPQPLVVGESGTTPVGNLHSTPDINEANGLKEGIIYHGLDPRFPNQKVFFLVEALKKDDRGIAAINKKFNTGDIKKATEDKKNDTGGKEWYGLMDKFTALPMIAMKLLPLIGGKLIPLIVKIIQLVSDPSKIKTMLLDLVTDEKISKFAKNFTAFSKRGTVGKVAEIIKSGKTPPTSFGEPEIAPLDKMFYAGVQLNTKHPKIISMLDGEAVAEFGKGAFKKPLFTFGVKVELANYTMPFKPITKRTEANEPAKKGGMDDKIDKAKEFVEEKTAQTQALITLILNFIKMPFEIIFMIFQWVIKWVKKLLNPIKIPAAIAEFVSFKWLLDIIGQKSLFAILGMVEPNQAAMDKMVDAVDNDAILNKVVESLKNGDGDAIEVLVYQIFKDGIQVGEEIVERPLNGKSEEMLVANENDAGGINGNSVNGSGVNGKDKVKFNPLSFCTDATFNINDILPIPFFVPMPTFNMCEMPILFLKPLQQIGGLLRLIQELLNALIAIPVSIFGLEPHIKIPKLAFYEAFEKLLKALMDKMQQPSLKPF